MAKNCRHCGRLTSVKPGSKTMEFDTTPEFRADRPDVPLHIYLCPKCGEDSEVVGWFKGAPWYAGYRIL